jgi:hypothetical protein
MHTVGVTARCVVHPVTLAAAAVLLLNDRVGKSLWPGPVTGKASDVAGLVVAPAVLALLLALLVPRAPVRFVGGVALAATGTGFALAKVTAAGNAVAVAGWEQVAGSAQVVRDPTDLVALPALVLAALVCRTVTRRVGAGRPVARRSVAGGAIVREAVGAVVRGAVAVARRAGAGTVAARRPAGPGVAGAGRVGRWRRSDLVRTAARWGGALLGGPLVLVALAGTSAASRPPAVTRLLADGDQVVAAGTIRPAIGTPEGGWRRLDTADARRLGADRNHASLLPAHTLACVPGSTGHCFRIPGAAEYPGVGTPGAAEKPDSAEPAWGRAALWVQETTDGGGRWRTVWQVPPERWVYLSRAHADLFGSRDDDLLASVDILIRAVPGGYQVVVANGVEGLVVRDADGGWRRLAVRLPESSAITPLPLTGFGSAVRGQLAPAPLLGLLGAFAAVLAMFVRCSRVVPGSVPGAAFAAVTVTGFAGLLLGTLLTVAANFLQTWMPTIALGVLTLAGTAVTALGQPAVPRRRAWPLLLVPLVVALGYAVPYLGWSFGVPGNLLVASLFALVGTVDTVVLSVAVGWWLGESPMPPVACLDVPPWHRGQG